jgi:hypothetical protein
MWWDYRHVNELSCLKKKATPTNPETILYTNISTRGQALHTYMQKKSSLPVAADPYLQTMNHVRSKSMNCLRATGNWVQSQLNGC